VYPLFLLINSNIFLKHSSLCKWYIPSAICNEHIQGNYFTQSQLLVISHQVTYDIHQTHSLATCHTVYQSKFEVSVSHLQYLCKFMCDPYAKHSCYTKFCHKFRWQFPNEPLPHTKTIHKWMKCLWTGGSISDSTRTCRSHILKEKKLDEICDKQEASSTTFLAHPTYQRDVYMLLPQNALNCCLHNHTGQLTFTKFMI